MRKAVGSFARSLPRTAASASTIPQALANLGIRGSPQVYHNLSYEQLLLHERRAGEGVFSTNGAFCCDTGAFTGRSPKDKYIVAQPPSQDHVWWGEVNQPTSPDTFARLREAIVERYRTESPQLYVFEGYCGASPASQRKVRIITEFVWQHHFVTNMFIRQKKPDLHFEPDFTILNGCRVTNVDYKQDDMNSDCFVMFNIEEKEAIIGGTWYTGEMKKGLFSMMNYWLPQEDIMSMHCSANIGPDGDTALFFGLSGTGKTTLSADASRQLIGDDEHGWDDEGVFNLEGGCYAKTIGLSEDEEPDIYRAVRQDALLENIVLTDDGIPDYHDVSKTQNGRVSYPIHHILNAKLDGQGAHPTKVLFLTCDAYGVLPPVARLTTGQAMYHFLSGYTAKIEGTERGVTEPEATFSACFGKAFLTLHPSKYADLLARKLEAHGTHVYLVNTGWSGGGIGVGERMPLATTRACVDAILDGSVDAAPSVLDQHFGFDVPCALEGIPTEVLLPHLAWSNPDDHYDAARELVLKFQANYESYRQEGMTDYSEFGPS